MPSKKWGLFGLLLLSACSSSGQQFADARDYSAGTASCASLGFVQGTAAYQQCQQDAEIQGLVNQRIMLNGNNNQPLGMLVQQYNKPLSPLLNCTSYAVPVAGQPTLCD